MTAGPWAELNGAYEPHNAAVNGSVSLAVLGKHKFSCVLSQWAARGLELLR